VRTPWPISFVPDPSVMLAAAMIVPRNESLVAPSVAELPICQ